MLLRPLYSANFALVGGALQRTRGLIDIFVAQSVGAGVSTIYLSIVYFVRSKWSLCQYAARGGEIY